MSQIRYQLRFSVDTVLDLGDTIWSVTAHGQQRASQQLRAAVGAERLIHAFGRDIPDLLRDLLDIALAVYAGDRMCPRRTPSGSGSHVRHWRRHIEIELPLREHAHWNSPAQLSALAMLLDHFTGDHWSFEFLPRATCSPSSPFQRRLFPVHADEVAAFSGGLDSLAGVYHRLVSNPDGVFSVIAGGTSGRTKGRQSEILRALDQQFGSRLIPVRVPYGLFSRNYSADSEETSQRSRGFMHLMLVAAAALMLDKDAAYFYENGLGAIGIPYQVGMHTSRAVHPTTFAHMRAFLIIALDTRLTSRNPFITETKGTMCARLTDPSLRNPILRSVSCDDFPQRIAGSSQCGICPACLMRRVSLYNACLSDADSGSHYRFDVMERGHALSEQRLYVLRLMLDQVELFRQCIEQSGWQGLVLRFPDLATVADAIEQEEGMDHDIVVLLLTNLFSTYIGEWDRFPYQLPSPNLALCS